MSLRVWVCGCLLQMDTESNGWRVGSYTRGLTQTGPWSSRDKREREGQRWKAWKMKRQRQKKRQSSAAAIQPSAGRRWLRLIDNASFFCRRDIKRHKHKHTGKKQLKFRHTHRFAEINRQNYVRRNFTISAQMCVKHVTANCKTTADIQLNPI